MSLGRKMLEVACLWALGAQTSGSRLFFCIVLYSKTYILRHNPLYIYI